MMPATRFLALALSGSLIGQPVLAEAPGSGGLARPGPGNRACR